ncbi:MAG: hypothetical protein QMC89_06160 [Candidatus Hodarchaeaceae archaeon]|nr:hypothetical protein [Candidatus Hodarchaeaceae archaeon]
MRTAIVATILMLAIFPNPVTAGNGSPTFDDALREALIGSSGILMLVAGFWYLLKKWGER